MLKLVLRLQSVRIRVRLGTNNGLQVSNVQGVDLDCDIIFNMKYPFWSPPFWHEGQIKQNTKYLEFTMVKSLHSQNHTNLDLLRLEKHCKVQLAWVGKKFVLTWWSFCLLEIIGMVWLMVIHKIYSDWLNHEQQHLDTIFERVHECYFLTEQSWDERIEWLNFDVTHLCYQVRRGQKRQN